MRQAGVLALITLITPLAGLGEPARQPPQTDNAAVADLQRAIQDANATAEPSVVAISRTTPLRSVADDRLLGDTFAQLRPADWPQRASTIVGAGVMIDPTGLVLTQYLAVNAGDQHFITTTKRQTFTASVRAADARCGLAVLAIDTASPLQRAEQRAGQAANKQLVESAPTDTKFPAVRFGDADALRRGEFVISIGNPYAILSDGEPSASWGIVTNIAQKAPTGTNLNDSPGPANDYRTTLHHLGTLIQTDAKLGWSAGGGALVNLRGELVGLTTSVATIAGHEQPAGYAIPMNTAFRRIIDALKDGREVEYGMLGVGFGMQPLDSPTGARSRLAVMQVYPGTPAAKAGLETGDAILQVDGKPVSHVDGVQLAVSLLPPGASANVAYTRNGRAGTTQVTLAKLAAAGRNVATAKPAAWHGMRVDYATAMNAQDFAQAIASANYDPQGCMLVTDVEPDSEAWKAGVRPGMFVSHVGNKRVSTPAEFRIATETAGSVFNVRLTKPVSPSKKVVPDAGTKQ